MQQWYRLLQRSSGFLSLDLHDRVAMTLLELSSDFGIKESRGMLLGPSFSHQDIADLAGGSRPRVTEHLAQLEREHLLIRQGRQLIVCADEIGIAITIPSTRDTDRRPTLSPRTLAPSLKPSLWKVGEQALRIAWMLPGQCTWGDRVNRTHTCQGNAAMENQ